MADEHIQNSNPIAAANGKGLGVTRAPPDNATGNAEDPGEPSRIIYWEAGDPDNPHNWSTVVSTPKAPSSQVSRH